MAPGGPAPLVIVGPSGVGKSVLIKRLQEVFPDRFGFSVSHTTRAPRPGEVNGKDYHFSDFETLKRKVAEGKILESCEVHGNMYGTSREAVEVVRRAGKICILDIDVKGAQILHEKNYFPSMKFVFLHPPSLEVLEKRLRGRGTETEEKVRKRLAGAMGEIEFSKRVGFFSHQFVLHDGLQVGRDPEAVLDFFALLTQWYPMLGAVPAQLLVRRSLLKVSGERIQRRDLEHVFKLLSPSFQASKLIDELMLGGTDADIVDLHLFCSALFRPRGLAAVWERLAVAAKRLKSTHLKVLLADHDRNDFMYVEAGDIVLDYCREKVDADVMKQLFAAAKDVGVFDKRRQMYAGVKINETEGRPVLHVALRASRDANIAVDGKNVVPEVWKVLDSMKDFSNKVRSGEWRGHTGKVLKDVVCIGIGGSYLGVEFVFEALKTDPDAAKAAKGRNLRFLANVDPIDVKRALSGLNPEETLVVVISKTFTTAETMLNAKTVKEWLITSMGPTCVSKHVVACSTALEKTQAFGIDPANVFGFWDWVGGRFSVWSAVGVLALSLQYGFGVVQSFLEGGRAMDKHFLEAPNEKNVPLIIGLLSVWNSCCMGYGCCAVLPYCQALVRFVAHVQQLDMESNGKRVTMDGKVVAVPTGAIYFGEPGTNGQHSFYQLLHQGRVAPAEFLGFVKSQHNVQLAGEPVSNHDELMSNFFAQPDALALGKTAEELKAEGVKDKLIPHKTFPGDRPSLSLLLPVCNPFYLGQLLALYEHRTAVQGWFWDINSFDQWGVELGKVLANKVRAYLSGARAGAGDDSKFIRSSRRMLARYLKKY